MKGSYKVYNANKEEWVNLPLNYVGEGLQLKIENNRLWASYDGGQTWNDIGEVGDNIKLKIENNHLWSSYDGEKTWEDIGEINTDIDKTYVDENFAKKDEVVINKSDDTGIIILDDEGVTIASGNEEQMLGYLGVSEGNSVLAAMNYDGEVSYQSVVGANSGDGVVMTSMSQNEYEESYKESTISVSPDQILLQHTNDDTANTVTLDSDGLKYNDSPVITVDENGVVNKNEITIGSFEIKNDKPYNYTLEGRFYPYDPSCAEGFKVVAQYDQEGVKCGDIIDGSQGFGPIFDWYYGFVITDILFEDLELGDDIKNTTLDRFLNRNIPVLAAYIDDEYTVDGVDTVTFTDDVSEELSVLYTTENRILDVTFTRSAPFSLKHTSKALLNGVPVVTANQIPEISNVPTKVSQLENDANFINKTYVDNQLSNIAIVKGDANNSAVLNGEYAVSGTKYKNKAISQVSMSAGAASTAGLKGWYYTKVNLSTNQIWLSDTRLTNKIPIIGTVIGLKIETTTSTTPDSTSFNSGWKVGDEVTIVNDKKYDRCAKITAINGNMIKLDKLPFDSETIVESAASIGDYNEPDEFSITAVRITDNDTLKTRSVSSYDKGNVDFGGGACAEGVQTYALNIGAHAEGIQTIAHGQYSHAEGFRTEAAYAAHAEGRNCKAIGPQSHAEGENSEAHGNNSHVEGKNSKTLAKFSHAEGNATIAKGEASHTEGYKTISANNTSHAEGSQTVAYGGNAHAEGQGSAYDAEIYNKTKEEIVALWDTEMKINCALGRSCHTEGLNTLASGDYSHAEGQYTKAAGSDSHAEGNKTKALENNAHAEGVSTVASGNAAHAEGNTTISEGKASHAEGIETKSSNEASHAEGYKTEASGLYAHAEGNQTKATGKYSHAEGYMTEATNNNAHTEGNQTKAHGNSAHAEGKLTVAAKDFSHAGGLSSTAEGIGSFAHGNYVTATKDYEIAFGNYNNSTTNTLFSVGNGTSESTRKNVFEITTDGLIYIYKKDGTRVCLQDML